MLCLLVFMYSTCSLNNVSNYKRSNKDNNGSTNNWFNYYRSNSNGFNVITNYKVSNYNASNCNWSYNKWSPLKASSIITVDCHGICQAQ